MVRALRQRVPPGLRALLRRPKAGSRFYGRGLAAFEAATPPGWPTLTERIEALLSRRERVRLLEVGCGEGRLLLDLMARFGERVALHGLNHPTFGGWRRPSLDAVNRLHGTLAPERLASLPRPVIRLGDAQAMASLGPGWFDLVVSQVTLHHVRDKARALEQSARLLGPGGALVHQLDRAELERPGDELPRFEIWQAGRRVSTAAVLAERGLRVANAGRSVLVEWTRAPGVPDLALGLTLDASACVNLKRPGDAHAEGRWGWRSVYRLG
ncbi:MAG: methyltransferase domain-containing protein [Acidimicrobiales bacterium]